MEIQLATIVPCTFEQFYAIIYAHYNFGRLRRNVVGFRVCTYFVWGTLASTQRIIRCVYQMPIRLSVLVSCVYKRERFDISSMCVWFGAVLTFLRRF